MERDPIIAKNPIIGEFERRGFELKKRSGTEVVTRCPFHQDTSPSLRINPENGTWFCDPCGFGGSVIDFVMRADGLTTKAAMLKLAGEEEEEAKPAKSTSPRKIVATYDYQDETGRLLFQVTRSEPKDFRQRQPDGSGGWKWSLDGVRRVLYRLPEVTKADFVWIVEGEKDADTLVGLGLCATCNPGGAGKWDDSYTTALRDKEVILCGDNDAPGAKHVEKVKEALGGAVKSSRVVKVPPQFKDVSDFVASFSSPADAILALLNLADGAETLFRGIRLPIYSTEELEREYMAFATRADSLSLDLKKWLPALGRAVRPLVPGELAAIIAGTGVGKTMLLQNLALNTELPTLFFEMELPGTLVFERFAGMVTAKSGGEVLRAYKHGAGVPWRPTGKLDHIHTCYASKLDTTEIERVIRHSGLKTGRSPVLVLVDYAQLIGGAGMSRYERMSTVMEDLKVVAKQTQTIVVVASQVARKNEVEVTLQDGKDSGSIENSAGLVIGAWRDPKDTFRLMLKVLKNTKALSGTIVACRIREGVMTIHEEAREREEPVAHLNGNQPDLWHES